MLRDTSPYNPPPRELHSSRMQNVLLVDPHEDTRNLYAGYLELAGCEIDVAEDGREALAKALAQPHDAIVTETRLPGIDGYQLCHLLRTDPATLRTPILIVTADARMSEQKAHAIGADGVLVKPCRPESILDALRQIGCGSVRGDADVRAVEPKPEGERAASPASSHRAILSRVHRRGATTTPPAEPPTLHCPLCDRLLEYERSYIGGVSMRHAEQWDYFACRAGCGRFEYRQRTRKIRRVESD